ncbi:MAG: arginine--tRNA ligase [Candidatus Woesearchaeota archaeon]|nr:MAG: arginine--tRNA ligase [Candidatus Woesearchaeota archaeon]
MQEAKKEVVKLLKGVKGADKLLEVPPDPKLGDLSLPCFNLSKNPKKLADDLKSKIKIPQKSIVKEIKTAGPYLNFYFDKGKLAESVIKQVNKEKDKYGKASNKKKTIIVEYSNPNPLKGFHVGHLRNTALGAALYRILEKDGYKVIKANYYNNTGSHVAKTLWAYKKFFKKKESKVENKGEWVGKIYSEAVFKLKEKPNYEKEVLEIQKKIDKKNKEWVSLLNKLNNWSVKEFNRIYRELGAKFDYIYYDKDFIVSGKDVVKKLEKHHLVEYEDKAPIINLEKYQLGKKPLLRADGTALYITKDLAMAQRKFKDYKLDRSIYVVGAEQDFYFKQLFKTLKILGFDKAKQLYHLSYELVLDKNMKKFSSRLGDAPLYSMLANKAKEKASKQVKKKNPKLSTKKQKEIADKIAVGAMIYMMLNKSNKKRIPFDLDKALSYEGDTGPYLQYALVRAKKILKKAKVKPSFTNLELLNSDSEYELIKKISNFPLIIEKAAESYSPHLIANYAYDLSKLFSNFYEKCPVIKAKDKIKKARLALVSTFTQTLKNSLNLLGIKEVELM